MQSEVWVTQTPFLVSAARVTWSIVLIFIGLVLAFSWNFRVPKQSCKYFTFNFIVENPLNDSPNPSTRLRVHLCIWNSENQKNFYSFLCFMWIKDFYFRFSDLKLKCQLAHFTLNVVTFSSKDISIIIKFGNTWLHCLWRKKKPISVRKGDFPLDKTQLYQSSHLAFIRAHHRLSPIVALHRICYIRFMQMSSLGNTGENLAFETFKQTNI